MPTKGSVIEEFLTLGEKALSALLEAAENKGEPLVEKAAAKFTHKLDLVTRDEFDAAFAMLKKIRAAHDQIGHRLDALEKRINPPKNPKSGPSPKMKAKTKNLRSVKQDKRRRGP